MSPHTDAGAFTIRLEARPADDSHDWVEIYPAQLQWMAKEGNQVRAIEVAASHGSAAPYVDPDLDRAGNRRYWADREASQGSAGGEADTSLQNPQTSPERPDLAQEAGNSGETAQPGTGPMRLDLMLEKVDAENAQNGEAFNDMRAHVWAAGASHEDADFITRMLTRKGLYLFQTEPWKRCPSTHCERRAECASARDCTVKTPSVPSASLGSAAK